MTKTNIPGERTHRPPAKDARKRLTSLQPYVREAWEGFRPAWCIKSRKLFDFLLVHVLEGTGVFTVDGTRYDANPGSLFWIPPDTLHEMQGNEPGTYLQYIHFDLTYDPKRSHWSAYIPGGTTDLSRWPQRMHPAIDDPALKQWCGRLDPYNPVLTTGILHRIILEYNGAQMHTLAVAGSVLELIWHLLESNKTASPLNPRHVKTMENAMRRIQLNIEHKINIEALARQHGLSPTHFRRLFREHYNQTPREAYLAARMRRACDALVYTDLSISEIAARNGFTNVHNFSRAFRKALGQAPSAFRRGSSTLRKEPYS